MAPAMRLLAALMAMTALLHACEARTTPPGASAARRSPATAPCPGMLPRAAVLRMRGGEDELDEDFEGEEEEAAAADAAIEDTEALENPFLGSGSGGPGGAGLQDLAQSLQDPQVLQEALKELQDPETIQRIRAMMEDPDFLESMKQYVEQVTQDPQFEQLKAQTEKLMQEPGFVEQMTQALMGGDMSKTLAEMSAALGAKADGEEGEGE